MKIKEILLEIVDDPYADLAYLDKTVQAIQSLLNEQLEGLEEKIEAKREKVNDIITKEYQVNGNSITIGSVLLIEQLFDELKEELKNE